MAFVVAFLAVITIAGLSYLSLRNAATSALSLTDAIETVSQLQTVMSSLKDAETGQRGFLLTNRESYLLPFSQANVALGGQMAVLARLIDTNMPQQQQRFGLLQGLTAEKMAELSATVALRRAGQPEQALTYVLTDRGKNTMDQIRVVIDQMVAAERTLISTRTLEAQSAATVSFAVTGGGSAVLLCLIATAALLAARDFRVRQLDTWLRTGQIGIGAAVQGDPPLDRLSANVLDYLAIYSGAQVGALLIAESGHLRRIAGYALPAGVEIDRLRPGDGLAGQVAKANRVMRVRDVPAGYLPVGSAVGHGTPNELLIAPIGIDGVVLAVVELGFFGTTDSTQQDLLARVAEQIAVAIRASQDRSRLEELLQETMQQAEELQTREEELRVNNEELEEQGRSLRESRAQLESQQEELEQINSQLEEQAQVLEQQKDELSKSHRFLSEKAEDLARANEYKSEFLANMSHELRTPLNSTLILAKLLADNKTGNLTEQQVKFAQTISSAGNDLLDLINDVLDLSRIEAGKIDLATQPVPLAAALEALNKTFLPLAEQKRLNFSTHIEPGTPATLETDPQRLAQILKNLISNALKFTEKGGVSLQVFPAADGRLAFAVRDTGVGIAAHQQEVIFEAFRQADGSIHRKYGGTGLGLSISRDLARLLGGTIDLHSAVGEGSVFTLTLPLQYEPMRESAPPPGPRPVVAAPADGDEDSPPVPVRGEDRSTSGGGGRLILVIEDDVRFAAVLRDLVCEMGFRCAVTHSATEGLVAATDLDPSAILLDITLADAAGLNVLDRLKEDARTRHIPVHAVCEPAKREELVEALRALREKSPQSLRRVLIVEDDPRQRESISRLLAHGDVQIVEVATAGDALRQLESSTFDCMVMDFNLPDYSGYDLLETMAREENVTFPPVIVYTGRVLSLDEEQRLRRYSKSIIIKDARSPERLLDEVTLFLHQVESKLPPERQQMLKTARSRDRSLEGRRVLVVEDDVRNIFALSSVLEPKGAKVEIARNGVEALSKLSASLAASTRIDLVLMDIMMPEMDGFTAMREIRKRPEWKKLPIIALTAKAMKDDQEKCLSAGANDYIAKPLDVEKLLSLVRVWMPK